MSYFDPAYFASPYFDAGSVTLPCFDPAGFDPTGFDTTCGASTGGGHPPRGRRRVSMPVIDTRMHDDELALLILEAA